jgi:cell division protein FtsL
MATARRAYTSEYAFNLTPEVQPERVKRTRQRPERKDEQQVRRNPQGGTISADTLRALIVGVLAIGIILIGVVIVNAHTASLQYAVNQLESQNAILQTEIDMLEVKIGSNTSISQLEDYATTKLAMHYPEGNECIHLATVELPEENLADIIKQKAYA